VERGLDAGQWVVRLELCPQGSDVGGEPWVGEDMSHRRADACRSRTLATEVDAEAVVADPRVDVVLTFCFAGPYDRNTMAHCREHAAKAAVSDEDVRVRNSVS
jgi:hypothetical protein